jgi:N-terminal domain on NACHT_NTPase and P-loop NTPases
MSGIEVLGGIGAVIAIIDGSVKVCEGARKDAKLGMTFETVGNQLPILRDILQTCHEHFKPIEASLPDDAAQGLLKTIDNCQRRARELDTIFKITISSKDDQWWERSRIVAQRLGEGSKVEELMKAIAEDVQNLVNYHAVKPANPTLYKKLEEIIKETALLAASPSSTVPFRRDVDFVDRGKPNSTETILEHIEQRCKPGASRVALVGIGGAG